MPEFRKSTLKDTAEMARIGESAKLLLKSRGVPQWQRGTYPDLALFEKDAEEGIGYVVAEGDDILAVCALTFGEEADYRHLTDGAWLLPDGSFYATIHRCAVSEKARGKHVSTFMFDSAAAVAKAGGALSLRADTHPMNLAMQGALTRAGFVRCGGLILLSGHEEGDPRVGYERLL